MTDTTHVLSPDRHEIDTPLGLLVIVSDGDRRLKVSALDDRRAFTERKAAATAAGVANGYMPADRGALRALALSRRPTSAMGQFPFLLADVADGGPTSGLGMVHCVASFASVLLAAPTEDLSAAVLTLATAAGLVVVELVVTEDERQLLTAVFTLAPRLAKARRHDLEARLRVAIENFARAPSCTLLAFALGSVCKELGVAKPTRSETEPSGAWFIRMIADAFGRLSAMYPEMWTTPHPGGALWFLDPERGPWDRASPYAGS